MDGGWVDECVGGLVGGRWVVSGGCSVIGGDGGGGSCCGIGVGSEDSSGWLQQQVLLGDGDRWC